MAPSRPRHETLLNSFRLPSITSPHRDLGEQGCSTDIAPSNFLLFERLRRPRCLAVYVTLSPVCTPRRSPSARKRAFYPTARRVSSSPVLQVASSALFSTLQSLFVTLNGRGTTC